MDWSSIEHRWPEFIASAKERWGRLSLGQLDGTLGKREQLSSRVQEAYSVTKEDADRQITDWQGRQTENHGPAAKN